MSDIVAPYVRKVHSPRHKPIWRFERKGHRTHLPRDMAEPWYSRECAEALIHSGLRNMQARRVFEGLPFSLAAGLLAWRKSARFRAYSGAHRTRLDMASERLCERLGWVDLRDMDQATVASVLPSGRRPAEASLTVLRAVFAAAGQNADDLALRVPPPTAKRDRPEISSEGLGRLLDLLPADSPDRMALLLMVYTGTNLASAMRIVPKDPCVPPAVWRASGLVRELPQTGSCTLPYVRSAQGGRIARQAVEERLSNAAALAGVPTPSRASLGGLYVDSVAETIVGAS